MADLMNITFAPVRWVIPGLLPEGLAILSGAPKIGKSWLVMNLCLAVSAGGYVFGRIKVDTGDVLLLSLEDNERRLQDRCSKSLKGGTADLTKFHARTEWKRLDKGGLEDLANWLDLHPACKCVVIDTMQKIKAHSQRKNGNAYEADYDSYGDLQRLALKHCVCILVIHHNRKSDSKNGNDPLEQISGSTGTTGAVDTILMLCRPRGAKGAVLTATGRDIEEVEYAMEFDGTIGQWVISGAAAETAMEEGSNACQVLAFLKSHPDREFTIQEICDKLGCTIKFDTLKRELYRLADKKIIVNRRGNFSYHAPVSPVSPCHSNPPKSDTNDASDMSDTNDINSSNDMSDMNNDDSKYDITEGDLP